MRSLLALFLVLPLVAPAQSLDQLASWMTGSFSSAAQAEADTNYYTIELEDAIIVDVQSRMPNCQDPGQAHFTHLEDVYLTYRKIVWTHEVSGTSGSDDWRTPISA